MHQTVKITHICLFIYLILVGSLSHAQIFSKNHIFGSVIKSSSRKVGEKFLISNIHSKRPSVAFPSGRTEEFSIIYEDKDVLVLQFVASFTGSTETIYINMLTNKFTLIEVGVLQATADGKDFIPDVTICNVKKM